MKIAIAQLNPTIGDVAGNARQILAAARGARGARLLLTPELSLCGYPPRDLLLRPGFVALMQQTLGEIAAQLPPGLAALVGTVVPNRAAGEAGEKPLFNSMALLEDGQVKATFHKRLLPTYDVFDDDRYFQSGVEPHHFVLSDADGSLVRFGVTICEDLWNDEAFWGQRTYPVNPTAELVAAGVDLVVNLSGSPYSAGKQQLRERLIRHAVQQHGCPIIYVNQVGGNDDLIFDGCSVSVNRQGEIASRLPGFTTGLQTVEYRKGDLLPAETAPLVTDPDAEIWSALVLGVNDYARKCGFKQAVVGLSGGIDSALVVAIAAAALGSQNVFGVLMPSPHSSDHSVRDAEKLAVSLGCRTETLPIGPLMQGYDQVLDTLFAGTEPGVTEENLQSRIRGNLLMAISNKFGYLLLSTGNKSELAVGYCTLYGDMNGGLAVIADVPKTRVYALCRWLNRQAKAGSSALGHIRNFSQPQPQAEIIPENILIKPPSAELKPGQVDQDSLPSYDVLDDILERLIQQHQSAADVVAAGHDSDTVERIVTLIVRAEFKRRQAPPVLKVTDRAFGTGWRMPIASRWSLSQQSAAVRGKTLVN